VPDLELEDALRAKGVLRVAGIDEAGRGPLAGPVSAAAVILPEGYSLEWLDDSKKMTAARREKVYEALTTDERVEWALAYGEVEEIEEVNILRATHAAMARAVTALCPEVEHCLIDGLPVPGFPLSSEGVVKGDGISLSIAAASVIAKVSRDRRMLGYAEEFPEYGFEKHKGYGTKVHLAALKEHGPCRIHRRGFKPVADLLVGGQR
jgi:ribonuclease HII